MLAIYWLYLHGWYVRDASWWVHKSGRESKFGSAGDIDTWLRRYLV
jgi:hypothetical protein